MDVIRGPDAPSETLPCVIVSNRLPVTARETADGTQLTRSAGGLVTALDAVLGRRGGTWIGWPGPVAVAPEAIEQLGLDYRIEPVALEAEEAERYYGGLANGALWPLLHSMPCRCRHDRADWEAYEHVNRRFAAVTAELLPRNGLAWFHDYHFFRAPLSLRKLRPDARIAFFLHVPFAGPDLMRTFPWHRSILRGMLACDLVGFHVESYARNFLDCAEELLSARVDRDLGIVELGGRHARVRSFPLGIDFERFDRLAREAPASEAPADLRFVLGVDRLDYTKGIPERLLAFETLLELHPELRGSVSMIQLAVPSRTDVAEYESLKRQLDELVGRVNGRFGTEAWTPIQYLYRSVSPERLAALYRDSDVALVTPLRDGMNLVAKEYVACQVREPGVLVLSELAGAAQTMREAILVNPFDVRAVAEALHSALTMEVSERGERIAALRRRERRDDVNRWVQAFLEAAQAPPASLHPLDEHDFEAWFGRYLSGHRLALLLDFDGTLSPIVEHPSQAVIPPEGRAALEACVRRPDIDVAIISGRAIEDVRARVGLEGIIYTGNHGLEMDGPGIEGFRHEDLQHYESRTGELAASLKGLARSGAWVEEKGATLTFHVRQAPAGLQERLLREARELIGAAGFQARPAHSAVEARPPIPWDKGHAALHLLRAIHGRDWAAQVRVLYAGDDETDEDAFRRLAGLALTLRVGPFESGGTAAQHRLLEPADLSRFLRWIAARPPLAAEAAR